MSIDPRLIEETADLLAKHRIGRGFALPDRHTPLRCSCGGWTEVTDEQAPHAVRWHGHLSEVLAEAGIGLVSANPPIKAGRYRRRAHKVIEAMRWDPKNAAEAGVVSVWAGASGYRITPMAGLAKWRLELSDGRFAQPGDWLVRSTDTNGETFMVRAVPDETFHHDYEPMPEEAQDE